MNVAAWKQAATFGFVPGVEFLGFQPICNSLLPAKFRSSPSHLSKLNFQESPQIRDISREKCHPNRKSAFSVTACISVEWMPPKWSKPHHLVAVSAAASCCHPKEVIKQPSVARLSPAFSPMKPKRKRRFAA
jgi:hypothetical protein